MKLDLGSWAENLKVKDKTATPSWGTALGQGKGYEYSFQNQDQYFEAMTACKVLETLVSCPMGKGGKKNDNYKIVRAALFHNIFVHYSGGKKIKLRNAKFIIIELEQLKGYHQGRKIIKYNKKNQFKESDKTITNEECFRLIESKLEIENKKDGWFVGAIEFEKRNELHLYVYVLKGKTSFNSLSERRRTMERLLEENVVSHYTSLDSAIAILTGVKSNYFKFRATKSDCLNDPNECGLGDMYAEIIKSTPAEKLFILSFCKTLDNPVMWRLYDSKIQFIFDKTLIDKELTNNNTAAVNLYSGDVHYAELRGLDVACFEKETGFKIEEDREKMVKNISLLKSKDFEIEDEWRIVAMETSKYTKTKKSKDLESGVIGAGSCYGLVKTYREISIPTTALKEIIVYEFDKNKFGLIRSQIEDLLDRNNIKQITIKPTECVGFRRK